MLYELLTGTRPFGADDLVALVRAMEAETFSPPSDARWAELVRDLLRARPEERLCDIDEIRRRIDAISPPSDRSPLAPGTTFATVAWRMRAPVPEVAAVTVGMTETSPPRRDNLPRERDAFVGRIAEGSALRAQLERSQLVTVTGPGGVGKTRLALHVARGLRDDLAGVAFCDLTEARSADGILYAVARGLDVPLGADPVAQLGHVIAGRGRPLLVIDNFEQVVEHAAATVGAWLDRAPDAVVLVTSREPLRLRGETVFPLDVLSLPLERSREAIEGSEAVSLFVTRAQQSDPVFRFTEDNADTIAQLVRRLDGLPLAIELAAARVKILPPAELRARIEHRLELLTGGARDLPERQQTLRRAIKWSYDLLTPAEQRLFRRLSVFAGGGTLEAIEAVCDTTEDLGVPVLEGVTSLVESSLLVQRGDDGEPRFSMLETFREYGRDALRESGEAEATERAHAAYMMVLAEEETLEMHPAQRDAWLAACDAEHDNFRAAIHHLVTTGQAEWAMRLSEAQDTLARVLAMPAAQAPTRERARALYGAAVLTDLVSENPLTAEGLATEACEIYRKFGDTKAVATTMVAMAWQAQRRGRYADATALFEETVTLWEGMGDATAADLARSNTATTSKLEGDFAKARGLLQQVATASEARGDVRGVASALNGLGDVASSEGDHNAARRFHHQSLDIYRRIGDRWGIAGVLADLGRVDVEARDYPAAVGSLTGALVAFRDVGHQRGVARQLELLSWCASQQGRDGEAVAMASAAAAIRLKIGSPARDAERGRINEALALARGRMTPDGYADAWRSGRTATLDDLLKQS
jgi:predicted ATPase